MWDITNWNQLHDRLNKDVGALGNTVIVIDGTTLDTCLSDAKLEKEFFEVAAACPSVCVCWCSPT